jgi:hypothetical protein
MIKFLSLLTGFHLCGGAWLDEPSSTLLQIEDLHHVGAFRVPAHPPPGQSWKSTFSYGGTGLAYNPKHHSLYVVGHDHHNLVAEIAIPALVESDSIAKLPTAEMLQPFGDITGGILKPGFKIGGLLVDGERLLWTIYMYYDAATQVRFSHGISTLTIAQPEARGPFAVAGLPAGAAGGYMTHVPDAWKEKFGVPVLSGQSGIPIIGRTSAGPAAVGFDPNQLGPRPTQGRVFIYYSTRLPLMPLTKKNDIWNIAGQVSTMAFVSNGGKSAVLYFGKRALGEVWYGTPERDGKIMDTVDHSKGYHGPPYMESIWFYDPNELLDVKARGGRPWAIRPYKVTKLPGFYPSDLGKVSGAAYDPKTGYLYISQPHVDQASNTYDRLPIIHVYQIAGPRR